MSKPWHRRKSDTPKAFEALMQYLGMGPKRSLRKLADEHHKGNWRKLAGWSTKYSWADRAAAYDAEQLQKQLDRREETQERLRQQMFDEASKALSILFALLRGKTPDDAEVIAQMDKQGNIIGSTPIVKPGTMKEIVFGILDRIGLTPTKRMEITGKDGKDLEIAARHKLEQMPTEMLEAIRNIAKGGAKK